MIGLSAAVQFALQSYEFKTWLRLQTGMDNTKILVHQSIKTITKCFITLTFPNIRARGRDMARTVWLLTHALSDLLNCSLSWNQHLRGPIKLENFLGRHDLNNKNIMKLMTKNQLIFCSINLYYPFFTLRALQYELQLQLQSEEHFKFALPHLQLEQSPFIYVHLIKSWQALESSGAVSQSGLHTLSTCPQP